MQQLEEFKNPLFQKQDLATKQKISDLWVDKNYGDVEAYANLSDENKVKFKAGFADNQIDFDVSDTIDTIKEKIGKVPTQQISDGVSSGWERTKDGVASLFESKPEDTSIVDTVAQAPQEQEPVQQTSPQRTPPKANLDFLDVPDQKLDVQYKEEYDNSNIVDQVQSSLLKQSVESARGLAKFSKRGLEALGADEIASMIPDVKALSQDEADFIVGYSQDNRVKDKKSMKSIKNEWSNGNYATAVGKAVMELPSVLADSSGEMAQLLHLPATALAISARVSKFEDEYIANNDGKKPDASWYAEAIATQSVLLLGERFGLKVLGKSIKNVKPKTAVGVAGGFAGATAFEAGQEYGEAISEEFLTQKEGAKTRTEIAMSDDAKFSAFMGGVAGFALKGATETGSVIYSKYDSVQKQKAKDAYLADLLRPVDKAPEDYQGQYNRSEYNRPSKESEATSVDENGMIVFDNIAHAEAQAQAEAKADVIQEEFTNLVINNPEIELPVEATESVALQEQIVADAKEQGLDVSNDNGLNAIDKGFKDLEAEIGNIETLVPYASEDATMPDANTQPTLDAIQVQDTYEPTLSQEANQETTPTQKDNTSKPTQQSNVDTARLKALEETPYDDLSQDEKFELEDLQAEANGTPNTMDLSDIMLGDKNKGKIKVTPPKEQKKTLEELQAHPRYTDLVQMRKDISASDSKSPNTRVTNQIITQQNNGKGWETSVTPALDTRNYNYDFQLTKQDIKSLSNGTASEDVLAKLESDLATLDNHPDYEASQYAQYHSVETSRAYDFLSTDTKKIAGVQGALAGLEAQGQNQLFDTQASEAYVTPSWAKDIVSDTTPYSAIITAVTNAKNGNHSELSSRVMQALHKAGDPHLETEIKRFDELNDRWDLNDLELAEQEELVKVLDNHLRGEEDGTIGQRASSATEDETRVAQTQTEDNGAIQTTPSTGLLQGTSTSESGAEVSNSEPIEVELQNATNLYEDDSPDLQAQNIAEYETGKKVLYTNKRTGKSEVVTIAPLENQAKYGRGGVGIVQENGVEFGVAPSKLSLIEDVKQEEAIQEVDISYNKQNYKIYSDGSVLRVKEDGTVTDFQLNEAKEDSIRKSASYSGSKPEYVQTKGYGQTLSKDTQAYYYAREQNYKDLIDKLISGEMPKNEATTISLNDKAIELERRAKKLNITREMYKNENELREYTDLDKELSQKYKQGSKRGANTSLESRSDTDIQETTTSVTDKGSSIGNNDVGNGGQARKAIVFDTTKYYSTKGIIADYPSQQVAKKIQKDVAKYVGQLATTLGYEFALDAKGKKLSWNGVNANLPPAGGEMSFKLFKPESDVGIYVSLRYDLDFETDPNNDGYSLSDGFSGGHLVRTVSKDGVSGNNFYVPTHKLTSSEFVDDIIYEVEDRIKKESTEGKDNDTNSESGIKSENDLQADDRIGNEQVEPSGTKGIDGNDDRGLQSDDTAIGTKRPTKNDGDKRDSSERLHTKSGVKNQFTINQNDATTQGEVARFNDNFTAIKILKQNKAFHTKEDLLALSRYTGWGGVQKLFPDVNTGVFENDLWRDRNREFRSMVSPSEYETAIGSILDAFYTPPKVISTMWDISKRLGFDGGHVLEPSVGSGRFIGMTPSDIKNVSFDGVELDATTAKIASILYPKSNIRNIGFEKTDHKDNFELVIGNPPYGSFQVYDSNHPKISKLNIHNYFVVKSLYALKDGGIANFVITSSFMENLNQTTANAINKEAKLVGAIRLPNNVFKGAGTEVTTDIVIFQKLRDGESGNIDEWFGSERQESGIKLNKYFHNNPTMLLGKWEKGFRGNKATALLADFDELLDSAISNLPENISPSFQGGLREEIESNADASVAPSVLYEKDGRFYVNIKTNERVEATHIKGKVPKSYIKLRDSLKKVIELQNENDTQDAELEQARKELNKDYDTFVSKHGLLNKAVNRNIITNDNYGYTVLSLEKGDKKTDIFTKRTSNPQRVVKTKDAKEALVIVLNTKGTADLNALEEITDKSQETIIKELEGVIFFDSALNMFVPRDVYLSGDVKTKLANTNDPIATKALLEVIPQDLEARDIPVQMGVSWISPKIIEQYAIENMGFSRLDVKFNKELAKWDVKGYSRDNPFSIPRNSPDSILEKALNQKKIVIKYNSDGRSYVDEEATAYANQKLEELKDSFNNWIFKDAKRSDTLTTIYNELYNRNVALDVDTSSKNYSIPNLKKEVKDEKGNVVEKGFKPRKHQKEAVYKAVYGNSPLLLNHPVGSGKTLTSQMIAMEWKRLGIANKPVIATLKSVVPQFANEFKIAYPNANILVPSKADFDAANRKKLLSSIATGNYDAIIITHDNLKALQNPLETQREVLEERIAELEEAVFEATGMTKSRLQDRIKKIKADYEEITNASKDTDVLSFDKLGIDGLIIDESHKFKKIGFSSTMDIKGIDTQESQMAVDLLIKSRHILKSSNNVVLMTGTPITNTLPELFAIQRLLQPELLKSQGIYQFDSWAKQYAVTESDIEVTGTGKFKEVDRIKRYVNLETLYQSIEQIIDTVNNNDIKKNDTSFILPKLKNGEPTAVVVPPSELQEQYIIELDNRLANVNSKDNPDNYLAIFGDAQKMSIDIRFVIDGAKDNPNSKASVATDIAYKKYKEFDEHKGVQLFFSDLGVPNTKGTFNLYQDIKDKLIAKGVPASEIALIGDYDNVAKKNQLTKDANNGKVRFVIGSTQKLGTGINMQKRIVATHHIDIPHTPAEVEQRQGRMLRQGNILIDLIENFEVETFFYATEKTLDGTKWQTLKNKAQFIKQFQDGVIDEDIDIDEGSLKEQAEKMIALSSGNPLLLDRIKIEKDLKKLRALKTGYNQARNDNLHSLSFYKKVLATADEKIEKLEADKKQVQKNEIKINSKAYKKQSELGQAVLDEILLFKNAQGREAKKIGSVGAIDIKINYSHATKKAKVTFIGESKEELEFDFIGQAPTGLGVKINNVLDVERYDSEIQGVEASVDLANKSIPNLEKSLEETFSKEDELQSAKERLDEINQKMADEAKEVVVTTEEVESDTTDSMKIPTKKGYSVDKSKIDFGDNANASRLDLENILLDENNIEAYRDIDFTDETWLNEFGLKSKDEDYVVNGAFKANEPIILKYGSLIKLAKQERNRFFTKIKPTLENPSVVAVHNGALVFFKSFVDGNKHKHFYSVAKDQNTGEYVISSNGVRTLGNLLNKVKEGKVVYIKGKAPSLNTQKELSKILASITTKSGQNPNDNSRSIDTSITNAKEKSQDEQEEQEIFNSMGGDNVGSNYIPTMRESGFPERTQSGTIDIDGKTIELPDADAPQTVESVREFLKDAVGNRLYDGRVKGKSVFGTYNRVNSGMRVKNYHDIDIMAHEMAHYLDYFYKNDTKKAANSFFNYFKNKNKEFLKSVSYTQDAKKSISEGFAEFVRLYSTQYNELLEVEGASDVVEHFELILNGDKDLKAKLHKFREEAHKYYHQGHIERMSAVSDNSLNKDAQKLQKKKKQKLASLKQGLVDKNLSIKMIEEHLRGKEPTDALNSPYKLFNLVNGADGTVDMAMEYGVPVVDAKGDISLDENQKSLDAIFKPLFDAGHKEVRLFENYAKSRRAQELTAQGRENRIDAQMIEESLKLADTYPHFDTIFNEYQEFNDAMLDFYVGMKLITQEQKQNFQEANSEYVPFHRVKESISHGKVMQDVASAKIGTRLIGGTGTIANIMDNIYGGLERNIKDAYLARAKSALFEMLLEDGAEFAVKIGKDTKKVKGDIVSQAKNVAGVLYELGFGISNDGMILKVGEEQYEDVLVDVEDIATVLEENPQLLEMWSMGHTPISKDKMIDSAIIDGQRVYFEINDAMLIDTLTSQKGVVIENQLMKIGVLYKNVSTFNITNNPLFYLTNALRDTASAGMISDNGFVPFYHTLKGMYHFVAKDAMYKNFMVAGGGYSTRATALGRFDDVNTNGAKVSRHFGALEKVLNAISYGADMFEYGTRIGETELALKNGKSNSEGASAGREVSTDFKRTGSNENFRKFLGLVAFAKAGINSIDRMYRRFRDTKSKGDRIKFYMMGAAIAGLSVMLAKANEDDERYKKLTKDQKSMHWWIYLDKFVDKATLKRMRINPIWKIPKPYDIGTIFANVPEMTYDYISKNTTSEELKDRFLFDLYRSGSVMDFPSAIKGTIEVMANKDWRGVPIESLGMQFQPKELRAKDYTPDVYKQAGSKYLSPVQVHHLANSFLGLNGRMLDDAMEAGLWDEKTKGERAFAKTNPLDYLSSRLQGKEVESRTKYDEKFYKHFQDINEAYGEINLYFQQRDEKNIEKFNADKKKAVLYNLKKYADGFQGKLSNYKKYIKVVKDGGKIPLGRGKFKTFRTAKEKEAEINRQILLRHEEMKEAVAFIESEIKGVK